MERYNIINYRNSLYTFDSSYSGLTFRNIGKLFDDSVMSEPISSLPEDVRQRWEYAAYLAKKHGLHISYNLIYTTTGRPDELYEIREKISKTMFVSPVMWIPLKNCGSLSSVRSLNNTYGFGFFPYAERRPFIYDDSVDIDNNDYNNIREYDLSTEGLYRIISKRIKLIDAGVDVPRISLDIDIYDKSKLFYSFSGEPVNCSDMISSDVSFDSFVETVLEKYNLTDYQNQDEKYIIVQYRHKEESKTVYDNVNNFFKAIEVLKTHINISTVSFIEDEYPLVFLYVFYDDTKEDTLSQHISFFEHYIDYSLFE